MSYLQETNKQEDTKSVYMTYLRGGHYISKRKKYTYTQAICLIEGKGRYTEFITTYIILTSKCLFVTFYGQHKRTRSLKMSNLH